MAQPQRWLFSPTTDGLIFFAAAVASAAIGFVGSRGAGLHETPLWAWVVLVVCIDVGHVWSTLFRVYLDGDEVRRRPLLYFATPLLCWVAGALLYEWGLFWRVLAYVAAWHFVRQQVGFMALYNRRAGAPRWRARADAVAIYAATVAPLVWWHAHLPQQFWWFVEGDFVAGLPPAVGRVALTVQAVALLAWLVLWATERHWGKLLLLAATVIAWFGGIVLAQSDFAFTAMNVVLHGVPYAVLSFRYASGRQREGGYGRWAKLLSAGALPFAGFLLALAFAEELLWDRLVWHDRPSLFGASGFELGAPLLALVVPLLALPQMTHYVLDGFVWRGKENPELAARLGWAPAASVPRG